MINPKSVQKEFQEIIEYLCCKYHMTTIGLDIKDTRCGRARYKTRRMTIPTWILSQVIEYQYAYVIHEVAHFIERDRYGRSSHGERFKRIETKELEEFALEPVYARAYTKELKYASGQSIWKAKDIPKD